jgi:hypothetical protein
MDYDSYLTRVIDDGIASVKADPHIADHPKRLRGSIEGFEACRGKNPVELRELLDASNRSSLLDAEKANSGGDIEDYWQKRHFALQVEWVCNCVSAALHASHLPTIVSPTYRGMMRAADILGVAEPS